MSDTQGPPVDQRRDELRVYLVIREDLALPRLAMAGVAARATWGALSAAMTVSDPRLAAYDQAAQPKVALRVKTEGQLGRVLAEAEAAGIPARLVLTATGEPAGVGLGPVLRGDLPKFIGTQRMLTDQELGEGAEQPGLPPADEDRLAVWVLPRGDIIPYGKLAPQAGHALWATVSQHLLAAPHLLAVWEAAGAPVEVAELADADAMAHAHALAEAGGLGCSYIVDQGRTCFTEATPTVVGVGPCSWRQLPGELRSMLAPLPGNRPPGP